MTAPLLNAKYARIIASLAITFSMPQLVSAINNGELFYPYLFGFALFFNFTAFIASDFAGPRLKKGLDTVVVIYFAVYAVLLLLMILLVPFQAYKAWLNAYMKPSGTIPMIFVASSLWFSAIAGVLFYSKGFVKGVSFAIVTFMPVMIVLKNSYEYAMLALVITIVIILFVNFTENQFQLSFTLFVIIVFLSITLCAVVVFKSNDGKRGWLSEYALKPYVKKMALDAFPASAEIGLFSGYGLFDADVAMGGEPVLTELPLLKMTIPENRQNRKIYLKTQSFDTYTGRYWDHSESLLVKFKDNKLDRDVIRYDYDIEVTGDYFPVITYPLATERITSKSVSAQNAYTGNIDTGFLLTVPLLKGDHIYIKKTKDTDITVEKNGETLETELSRPTTPMSKEEIYGYRAIVKNEKISAIAKSLKSPDGIPYTVENILNYLGKGFEFSLQTVPPEEKEDLVEKFLFKDRKGYSVHFASAFVIIARHAGIPARYVEGFLVDYPAYAPYATITSMNSHSWGEVYIDGAGWLRVETILFLAKKINDDEFWKTVAYDKNGITGKQLSVIAGKKPLPKPDTFLQKTVKRILSKKTIILQYISAVSTAFLLLYLVFRLVKYMRKRETKNVRMMKKYLRKTVRYSQKRGMPSPGNCGWIAWGTMMKHNLKKNEIVDSIVSIACKGLYSGETLSREEIYTLRRNFRKLAGN